MSKKITENSGRSLMTDEAKTLAFEYYFNKKIGSKEYTNEQIAEIINEKCGLDLDESAYRKWANNYITGYDRGLTEDATEEYIVRMAKSRANAMKEQKIANVMRREVHSVLNDNVKVGLIQNMVLGCLVNYKYKHTAFNTLKVPHIRGKKDVHVPIYVISDIHYGLNINKKNNRYNPKITRERLKQVADYIIEDCKIHKYKKIILSNLGDTVEGSGNLRSSQWLNVNETIMQQVHSIVDILTAFYSYLDDKLSNMGVEAEIYMVTDDNHGELRIGGTKRKEIVNDNVNIIIADLLFRNLRSMGETIYTVKREVKNKKYDVDNSETGDAYITKVDFNCYAADDFIIRLFNRNIYMSHGDKDKYSPNGDLVKTLSQRNRKILDIVLQGHFHSHREVTVGSNPNGNEKLIYVPCLCGDTDYANNLGYSSMPAALKLTISKKYGHIGSEMIVVK